MAEILASLKKKGGGGAEFTLTVTYTEDYYGATITATDGTTTLTATATSSGEVEFTIPNEGSWTVSATISGSAVSQDITIDNEFTTELPSLVPQGSTVTPTDDIQIWLKCANIKDKSYTTLAEVLDDRDTFENLLRDSNACDYMARSTTWTSITVPTMTSYTVPSGEVISSGNGYPNYEGWKAFSNDANGRGWLDHTTAPYISVGQYVGYIFENPVPIEYCDIIWSYYGQANTIVGKIQGYDGSDWIDLTEAVSVTSNSSNTPTKAIFTKNKGTYERYRWVCTTVATNNYTYGLCLQFYGGIVNNADAMALIGKYDYCSVALLKNNTWASAIANSDYFESVLNTRVPIMTSDTTPSGQVIYSTANSGGNYLTYGAFDGNTSKYWLSTDSSVGSNSAWCGYDFGYPLYLGKYELAQDNNRITGWVIEGTNDKTGTWYEVASVSNTTIPTTMTKYNIDTYGAAYRYYRFRITSTLTAPNSSPMREIQFYGHLVKEVLLPLVPAMTSNTTPSGEASATSAMSGYEAYKAFDSNTSTAWIASSGASGFDMSLTYQFANAVCAKVAKVLVYHDGNAHAKNYSIEASNDGSSYTTLTSGEFANITTTQTVDLSSNTTEYQYYRLRITSMYASANVAITELQYYDTTVQTNIIHSAANDTIYMMENNLPVVLTTTNSNGDGILDFSQFMDGTYTLYSSVAKDPTNLSNDYSKSVRITKTLYGGTTELYLMPDAVTTLYWYGYNPYNMNTNNATIGAANYGAGVLSITFNTNNISYGHSGSQAYYIKCMSTELITYPNSITTGNVITNSSSAPHQNLVVGFNNTIPTTWGNPSYPIASISASNASSSPKVYSSAVTLSENGGYLVFGGSTTGSGSASIVISAIWLE